MPPERASIEFTMFDETGVEVSYDRDKEKIIIEGWFNYIEPLDRFEITLEEFLKALAIPVEDIRSAYSEDCWGRKSKQVSNKKARVTYQYKRKTPELFKWHRKDKKPTYDIVCKWEECKKVFTTTDKKRKYCSQDCVTAWWKWQIESGEGQKKAAITRAKRKVINQKIKDALKARKDGQAKG